VLHKSVTYLLT